jgi:hypothetical protein
MQSRLDSQKVAPGGFRAMLALENYVRNSSGLKPSLLELVIGWPPVSYHASRTSDRKGQKRCIA